MLGSQRDTVLLAFAVSSEGARHAVPERASSTMAPCQQN
jgi:hypothetical protein